MYTPKTGAKCTCKSGVQRDNCPTCEGTGMVIDFKAIHAAREARENTKQTGTHTPGPWIATGNGGDDEAYLVTKTNLDGIVSHIARMYDAWICDEHGGTAKANARLIAAAPDMLAALKAFVQAYDCPTIEGTRCQARQASIMARAAIAKAEGK